MATGTVEEVAVNKLPITLVQFLKWAGIVGTGGEGKSLIGSGEVYLNGAPCLVYGKQLQAGDKISLLQIDFEENQEVEAQALESGVNFVVVQG